MTKVVGDIAEFDEALKIVLSHAADMVGGHRESVGLLGCGGRVLAEAVAVSLSAGSFCFISISELMPAAMHDGRYPKVKLAAFAVGFGGMAALAAYS